MAAHGTGRDPVRRAVAQLTAEGLLEPRRRRGTAVRSRPPRQRITRSRTVYRDEIGYYFDAAAQPWRALQPPAIARGPVPYDIAAGVPLLRIIRLASSPASRPLEVNDTRLNAEQFEVGYPDYPPPQRPRRTQQPATHLNRRQIMELAQALADSAG